jgi:hypothetical protein
MNVMEAFLLHKHLRDVDPSKFSLYHVLQELRRPHVEANGLLNSIRASYDRLAEHASPDVQVNKTAEIITFNVCGESVCLLKSSIAYAIPQSQLAIRVLGDWTEGESTRDAQGRFIIVSSNFSKH